MPRHDALDNSSRKSRRRHSADTCGFVFQDRDQAVLCDVFGQVALTLEDAVGLGLFGSRSRAQRRMALLAEQGFLRRFRAPDLGSTTYYYTLGSRAAALVAARLEFGLEQVRRLIRFDQTPALLRHAAGITAFRIAVQQSVTAQPDVTLERWLPERLIREEYDLEVHGRWRHCSFRPDAFFRLSARGQHFPFMVEVDMGNASYSAFERTVWSYARHHSAGLFAERYGQERFQVLVITTTPTRVTHLLEVAATQPEVEFLGTTRGEVERVGALGPIWSVVGRDTKQWLLVAASRVQSFATGGR